MRTPARRRASSLGLLGFLGVHGYSHARRSGVAQYELGMGREHTAVRGRGTSSISRACSIRWDICRSSRWALRSGVVSDGIAMGFEGGCGVTTAVSVEEDEAADADEEDEDAEGGGASRFVCGRACLVPIMIDLMRRKVLDRKEPMVGCCWREVFDDGLRIADSRYGVTVVLLYL